MAGTTLLTLLDDIASALDDVAVLTKIATKKTAGVLGDDLALNAQQVAGVSADRELHIVWAVAKGSAVNKAILVPAALLISFFAPKLITWLLILGGLFLCFEGFEKVFEKLVYLFRKGAKPKTKTIQEIAQAIPMRDVEKAKIKGAIRTDFILSAEIIVITLGTLTETVFLKQVSVLFSISAIMTIGVYGLVAGIVKLDDLGFHLVAKHQNSSKKFIGKFILGFAPQLMKFLGVAGTLAMFLVGGGILTHNISILHHFIEGQGTWVASGFDLGVGFLGGGVVAVVVHFTQIILPQKKSA